MSSQKRKATLLVVDDTPATLRILQRRLERRNYRVFTAPGVAEALAIINSQPIDLVITDLKMPKVSGLDLVRHVKENFKDMEVIMITGYPSIEGAVKAVKLGAEDFLAKPFTDDELFTVIQQVLDKLRARQLSQTKVLKTHYGLIGESEPMRKVFRSILKAAATSETVLISGESGTGKELVARAIHYNSPRSSASFVPVNCGSIPENLLERELFGHLKGSFTGATETRAGFFQTAEGGTIFLDEISEMEPKMQVKLLRVLQDKEVYMIGATHGRKVDVRILTSTNKDLRYLTKKGLFREDLYFRLNVINIDLPPLKDRNDDILLLLHHFTTRFVKELDRSSLVFSDDVLNVLQHYHWPGNVRELENMVRRLVVMTEGDLINVSDLPSLMRYAIPTKQDLTRTLAEVEADYIQKVLASVGGNKTKAAEILGIARATLREKLGKTKNT